MTKTIFGKTKEGYSIEFTIWKQEDGRWGACYNIEEGRDYDVIESTRTRREQVQYIERVKNLYAYYPRLGYCIY